MGILLGETGVLAVVEEVEIEEGVEHMEVEETEVVEEEADVLEADRGIWNWRVAAVASSSLGLG